MKSDSYVSHSSSISAPAAKTETDEGLTSEDSSLSSSESVSDTIKYKIIHSYVKLARLK